MLVLLSQVRYAAGAVMLRRHHPWLSNLSGVQPKAVDSDRVIDLGQQYEHSLVESKASN